MPTRSPENLRPPAVTVVDLEGITLLGGDDCVLDVLFDGRRIWSFRSVRDAAAVGKETGRVVRRAAWPPPLVRFLSGRTHVAVTRHGADGPLFEAEVAFDDSAERVAVVDRAGHPLGIDNTGYLTTTFDSRSAEATAPLLDAIQRVLGELGDAGIAAFPAYGTLLGAVRDGRLIGHDSDADLGYVSRYSHPFDVIRESFALQRRLTRAGYPILRYSGASFQVRVVESDGVARGLDVFGGYLADGVLHLMGEIRTPFRSEWLLPLGTCTLEGRTLPAPADPARLLEATYGPGWRVPDPAFRFETPEATVRAFDGYFRLTRANRRLWARVYHGPDRSEDVASPLARWLREREGVPEQLFDLGTGRAHDAFWFARQGSVVTGYDYVPTAATRMLRKAQRKGVALQVRPLNFQEWRSVLAEGARVARTPGPRVLLANHLFDATTRAGRDAVARFASMALRRGGRLYADFRVAGADEDTPLRAVPLAEVVATLERSRAHILAADELDQPESRAGQRTGRVVAEWSTATTTRT